MCLITFAYNVHPDFPLIVVSNRDEFYERPATPAHFWEDYPNIFAGRDLKSYGTWLGVSKNGRFAAITNYRDPSLPDIGEKSRGDLVRKFLVQDHVQSFYEELVFTKHLYGGYNFIGYDGSTMIHYNNILDEGGTIAPGVHSVSNASLNTAWPKTVYAKEQLEKQIKSNFPADSLKIILENKQIAADEILPDTGVGIHLERILSAPFVQMSGYGTRTSATVLFQPHNKISFIERLYENGEFIEENRYDI